MGQPASRALADCDQPLQGRPFVCIQGNPVLVHSGTPVLEVVHSPDTQEREDRPTRQSKIDDPLVGTGGKQISSFSKKSGMMAPGPAGIQPTPGLTVPGTPPPQPGMPPGRPGSPAPGPAGAAEPGAPQAKNGQGKPPMRSSRNP